MNWSGEGAFKVELLAIFDWEGREGAVRRGEGSVMGKFGEVSLVWLWLAQYIGVGGVRGEGAGGGGDGVAAVAGPIGSDMIASPALPRWGPPTQR